MDQENRNHPRFSPKGLSANISIEPSPPSDKVIMDGTIINISYSGIKIKLNSPCNEDIQKGVVTINLTLPESGVPITIRGTIKHLNNSAEEFGLQYAESHTENKVDNLMFECIKVADNDTQIVYD